jgi:hypothetical protein
MIPFLLGYWNGTAMNIAHGIIAICNKFMHAHLQRPECHACCLDITQRCAAADHMVMNRPARGADMHFDTPRQS